MTLGMAGIGFLVAMAEKLNGCKQLSFMVIGVLCFLVVIFLILCIFHINPSHIEAGLVNRNSEEFLKIESHLLRLDICAKIFFFLGVFSSAIVGILYVFKG